MAIFWKVQGTDFNGTLEDNLLFFCKTKKQAMDEFNEYISAFEGGEINSSYSASVTKVRTTRNDAWALLNNFGLEEIRVIVDVVK